MSKLNTYEKLGLAGGGIAVLWFAYTYFYYTSDYKKFKKKYCIDANNDGKFDNPYNAWSTVNGLSQLNTLDFKEINCRFSYNLYKFGGKTSWKSKLVNKII